MVVHAWADNQLLRRAVVASLAVHVLVALFLPTWIQAQSQGLQSVETISFAHLVRVAIMRPAAHTLPAAAPPETRHRAPIVSFARHKSELSVSKPKPHPRPTEQNGPNGPVAAAPKHVALHRASPLYAQPNAANAATHESSAAQTPQPQATVADHPVGGAGASNRGGLLPFGASQEPVLDPAVLPKLQAKVSGHVTLVVVVGEDGHTKHVEFQPPLDADTERAIEAILADATWDAAVCGGGVSCEGTATIKL
jgi:hypothetical protein